MKKWLDKYKDVPEAENGIEGTMGGLTDKGFNYNGAWGGTMAMGGSLPGSVGFTYARTQDPAPSKGKYAKKTMASAQDGKKISYNQWKKQNNLKETLDYNLKRAWELGYTPDKTGHLPTVDNQTGKFLKAKGHPTLKLELDWYNSPEGAEFKSKNTLDSTGKFFKYVPKLQNGQEMKFYQEGLDWKPKTISRDGSSLPQAQSGAQLSVEDQAILQDRKNRIKASVAARENGTYTKDNWRQQLADESQAIGDKFRIFPDDPNSIIDEYFNPAVAIGSLAADLGSAPLRAQQEDSYLPYASAIATPLITGALEGWGVKSNKQFAKNIINPFNFPGQETIKKYLGKGVDKVSKAAGNFAQDFSKGYRSIPTREDGGIIEDDLGQWAHPGEITKINSNQITMQGVDYPVLGISDTGDTQMMQPGQDYTYEGESVTEIPMAQDGYSEPDYATGTIRRGYNKAAQISNYLVPAETLNAAADIAKSKGLDFGIETRGPADAVRHAAAAASVSSKVPVPKLISDYSPNLDKAIRIAAANLLGFGHELKNMNEGFLMDIKNNYQGSLIGSIPGLTDKERNKMVVNQLINKQLTVDNPKKKKENGGWLSKYN